MEEEHPYFAKRSINGSYRKRDTTTGTCLAFGDPHYMTFDKKWLNFEGDCTYTLAETCTDIDYEPFSIEVSTKKARAPDMVTYVRSVYINVYGHQVDLTYEEGAVVDGTPIGLPVEIDGGKIAVHGLFWMQLITDFGLIVLYNRAERSLVEITLPGRYKNSLCGICGNWNGNSEDDTFPKGSNAAASDHEVGDSWISPNNPDIYCSPVTPVTADCAASALGAYAENCAPIQSSAVLDSCREKIGQDYVNRFVESCKFDTCMSGEAKTSLCDAATSMVDFCHFVVDDLIDWRMELGCSLKCPKFSTYNPGIRSCPDSCMTNATRDCSPFPVEGCQCDSGYVMSGSSCILPSQCGCQVKVGDNTFYHEVGHMWLSDDCKVHQTCREGGIIEEADIDPCGDNGECVIRGGLRKCYCKEGFIGDGYNCYETDACECSVAGGMHFHTCDEQWLDFQGDCTYTLMKAGNDSGLEPFQIDISTKHISTEDKMAYVRDVIIEVYNYRIALTFDYGIIVNGMLLSQPVFLEDDAIKISGFNWTKVNIDFGLSVTHKRDMHGAVFVHLPTTYKDHITGICGNWNGDKDDDMFPKGQTKEGTHAQVIDSWISEKNEDMFCVRESPEVTPCSAEEEVAAQETCSTLEDAPVFEKCRNALGKEHYEKYIANCMTDICRGDNTTQALFDAAANMVMSCSLKLKDPVEWREEVGAIMSCPPNSHYATGITECPSSCKDLKTSKDCFERPTEGCVCDLGYTTSGDTCVPRDYCGCNVIVLEKGDTVYEEMGKVWVSTDCSNKYTCDPNEADTSRSPSTAPMDPCDTHATCRDGKRGQGCYCDYGYSGNGHFCWDATKCQCSVSGNSHYRTFDSARIHFPGDCTYVLARTSNNNTDLDAFEVRVDPFKLSPNSMASYIRAAYVTVYEQRIVFSHDIGVEVNGVPVATPTSLVSGKVKISGMSEWLELRTDFKLVVRFKRVRTQKGAVELSVPRAYSRQMEGLCGDCDFDPENDLIAKGETSPATPTVFGDSWVIESKEDDGCSRTTHQSGPECQADVNKVAACAKLKTYEVLDECRVVLGLAKVKKYFEECLLDACVSDTKTAVCDSIRAMVFDCNINMTEPVDWRAELDCPFWCPADSIYSHSIRACQPDCVHKTIAGTCFDQPIEGCVCNDKFLRSGKTCVQPGNCGCEDRRKPGHVLYYEDETSFSEEGCSTQYLCRDFKLNTTTNCSEHASCQLREGRRDCYCNEGYEGDGFLCEPSCDVNHCKRCSANDRKVCEECEEDYPKNELSQLCESPCKAPHCDICAAGNSSLCDKCSQGYSINAISGQCEVFCTVPRCAICEPGNSTYCHTCSGVLVLNKQGQCEEPCNVINCENCKAGNPAVCVKCDRNFRVNNEGQCRQTCEVPFCANCIADQPRKCEDCVADYFLSDDGFCLSNVSKKCEVPYCATCVEDNLQKCNACVANYTLTDNGECVVQYQKPCKVPFCRHCDPTDNHKCLECVRDYKVENGTGHCVGDYTDNCEVPFCGKCRSSDLRTCLDCVANYELQDGHCVGNYSNCEVDHCQLCEQNKTDRCAKCLADRVLDEDGQCPLACTVPGCVMCRQGEPSFCVECRVAEFLTEDGECRSCNVTGCLRCVENDTFTCESCRGDLILSTTGKCDSCRVDNCASCSNDDADKCDRCMRYFTLTDELKCENCEVSHCSKCAEGLSDRCVKCIDGYMVDEKGQCTLACVVPGCEMCKQGDPNYCVQCQDEKYLVDGECESCNVPGCLYCMDDNPMKCKTCRGDLALSKTGGCDDCRVDNCASCAADDADKCDRCKRYYVLTQARQCEVPCKVDHCQACELGNPHKCVTCDEGLISTGNGTACKYPCSVPKCDRCVPGNPGWCKNCTGDLIVTEQGQCKEPCYVARCLDCDPEDPNFCIDCEDVLVITSEGQCKDPCHVDRCVDCKPGNSSLCINCSQGLIVAKNGTCREPCYVKHCDRCKDTDANFCLFCGDDMVAYKDGTCKEPCNVTDCIDCMHGNVSQCVNCIPGKVVALNGTCREPCNVAHCDRCNDTNAEQCRFCGDDMVVYIDGSCKEPCNVSHCIDCKHGDVLQCVNCEPGLVVADNGTCREPCNLPHCARCMNNNPNICVTCVDELVVGANGTCVEPCYIDNCARCKSGQPKQCAECIRDLEVSPNGTCREPCKVANCTECDSKARSRCAECEEFLVVADNGTCVEPCYVSDCVVCEFGNPNRCVLCSGDLEVSKNGTCKEPCQVPQCVECEDASPVRCAKCQGELVVASDGQCEEPCRVENCMQCEDGDPHVCLVCNKGLVVAPNGTCEEPCRVDQCEKCQEQNRSRCEVCKGDLIVRPDFTCGERCKVEKCAKCDDYNSHKCVQCEGDLYIANNGSKCAVPCEVENCLECEDGLRKRCAKCKPPLVVENGTCVELCNVPSCVKCVEGNPEECAICEQPLIVGEEGDCLENCTVANCEICEEGDPDRCKTCLGDLVVRLDGRCDGACNVPYCITCVYGIQNQCSTCAKGFELDENLACEAKCVVPDCAKCSADDGFTCETCEVGYDLKDGMCKSGCLIKHCKTCYEGQMGTCHHCDEGYYRNPGGLCLAMKPPSNVPLINNQVLVNPLANVTAAPEPETEPVTEKEVVIGNVVISPIDITNATEETPEAKNLTETPVQVENMTVTPQESDSATPTPGATTTPKKNIVVVTAEQTPQETVPEIPEETQLEADAPVINRQTVTEQGETPQNGTQLCWDENCLSCTKFNMSFCDVCADRYALVKGECILTKPQCGDLCVDCRVHGSNWNYCFKCIEGYVAINGSCTEKLPDCDQFCTNCTSKSGSAWCVRCVAGYQPQNGTCQEYCQPSNCQTCVEHDYDTCKVCNTGYMLTKGGECQAECTPAHCLMCPDPDMCTQCERGYRPKQDGTCQLECAVQHCVTCVEGTAEKCQECESNYEVDADERCRGACNVAHCAECVAGDANTCYRCEDGYLKSQIGECVEADEGCWDPLCIKCANRKNCDENKCLVGSEELEGECIDTRNYCVAHCADCYNSTTGHICLSCRIGYVLKGDLCAASCTVDHCDACEADNSTICKKCKSGFSVLQGKCVEEEQSGCSSDCLACTPGDQLQGTMPKCTDCPRGKTPKDNRCEYVTLTTCEVENCKRCRDLQRSYCMECNPGYALAGEGGCMLLRNPVQHEVDGTLDLCWDINCITCEDEGHVCLECKEKFVLQKGECTQTAPAPECPHCINCTATDDGPWCERCIQGYHAKEGKCYVSLRCEVAHCSRCEDDNPQDCKTCAAGYIPTADGINCQKYVAPIPAPTPPAPTTPESCKVINCETCEDDNVLKCVKCVEGFHLNGAFQCDSIEAVRCGPNCAKCLEGDVCIACKDGYGLNELGVCIEMDLNCWDDGCIKCAHPKYCDRCRLGFYLQEFECIFTEIDDCDENCDKCLMEENRFWCTKCNAGYTPVGSGCFECPVEQCAECLVTGQNATTCRRCNEGFMLAANKSSCDAGTPSRRRRSLTGDDDVFHFDVGYPLCFDPACEHCSDSPLVCDICQRGYHVVDGWCEGVGRRNTM